MTNVLQQWKLYIEWIHYKLFLKKKIDNLNKDTKEQLKIVLEKGNEYKLLKNREKEFIGEIENINNVDRNLKLYLVSQEYKKETKLNKLLSSIFKFDGYIFYLNKAEDLKIFKVKNLSFLYTLKKKEMYNLNIKQGTFKGKPFYLIKYPYAISLNVNDENELFYDSESYYNYVNTATKVNLTNLGNNMDLLEVIKKYGIFILIIIGLLFIFFTPEGQEFIKGMWQK